MTHYRHELKFEKKGEDMNATVTVTAIYHIMTVLAWIW